MVARKTKRWTIAEIEFMRNNYGNLTRRQMADMFGVQEAHIRDAMFRYKIQKPGRKPHGRLTDDEISFIRDKYKKTTAIVLAAELGLSSSTLWGIIQRFGLHKRQKYYNYETKEQTQSQSQTASKANASGWQEIDQART